MAMTIEYGKCAACGENNPKAATLCRACQATLPWVKQSKQMQEKPSVGSYDVGALFQSEAFKFGALFVGAIVLVGGFYFMSAGSGPMGAHVATGSGAPSGGQMASAGGVFAVIIRVAIRYGLRSMLSRDD